MPAVHTQTSGMDTAEAMVEKLKAEVESLRREVQRLRGRGDGALAGERASEVQERRGGLRKRARVGGLDGAPVVRGSVCAGRSCNMCGKACGTFREGVVELPDEVWGHVLSLMEDKDVCRLGAVCRAWRTEVDRLRPRVCMDTSNFYKCELDGALETLLQKRKVEVVLPEFQNVSLEDLDYFVRNMAPLGRAHALDLSQVSMYRYIDSSMEGISARMTDVSALGGVHTLILSTCHAISDVSALGEVHTLDLSYCSRITDVSALGGVHTLNLRRCSGITDVSALGGVHALDLSYCSITDVSALGGVHSLDLTYCDDVTDVSALEGVHTLNLSYCKGITDVSALGGVHTLNLTYCDDVTDVSALGGVHTLNLSCCSRITDVSALGGVHTLNLSYCKGITDVSALGGVHALDLSHCSRTTDVSALGGVHTLNLSCCSRITDVSALGGVHTLDLSHCEGIKDVSALGGVHTLDLSNCCDITDVSALRIVHALCLKDCHGLTDISALGGVHTLDVRGIGKAITSIYDLPHRGRFGTVYKSLYDEPHSLVDLRDREFDVDEEGLGIHWYSDGKSIDKPVVSTSLPMVVLDHLHTHRPEEESTLTTPSSVHE